MYSSSFFCNTGARKQSNVNLLLFFCLTEQDGYVVPMLLGNEGSQFVLRRWLRLLLRSHTSFHT